jgi:hypothetical protein
MSENGLPSKSDLYQRVTDQIVAALEALEGGQRHRDELAPQCRLAPPLQRHQHPDVMGYRRGLRL